MSATEFLDVLKSKSDVQLAVKRSGRWTTRPVWFVVDGATVYLLPVNGTDTKWYKHFTANPEIELSVNGRKVHVKGRPLLDAKQVADVTNRFRSKYGALERYYQKLDVAIAATL